MFWRSAETTRLRLLASLPPRRTRSTVWGSAFRAVSASRIPGESSLAEASSKRRRIGRAQSRYKSQSSAGTLLSTLPRLASSRWWACSRCLRSALRLPGSTCLAARRLLERTPLSLLRRVEGESSAGVSSGVPAVDGSEPGSSGGGGGGGGGGVGRAGPRAGSWAKRRGQCPFLVRWTPP